jgi:acetyltransferase
VVSIGDQVDVDFGDLLDHFAMDPATRAVLLYIESIRDARKFLSAARAVARAKPVVVIKSGPHVQAAKAAATHTGALAGSDAVYDAAFRRAGLLRVRALDELFDAAETLGRLRTFSGRRLMILTNGGGIGVLAVDRLVDLGGAVAELSPATLARLDAVLPPTWSRSNPVDIIGDADAERYAAALHILLAAPDGDAVLVLNVPTALASPSETAARVAGLVKDYRARAFGGKPTFAVWVGADRATQGLSDAAGIPHYETEADAVTGFMHLVRYGDAQTILMQTPPSLPQHLTREEDAARKVVERALADGRSWLDPLEVAKVFGTYAIPVTPVGLASDPEAAATALAPFFAAGGAAAVKIFSRDIVHKSDVGGVQLNLANAQAVREAAADIMAKARAAKPDARIEGVTVQPMILRPKARELIAGLADDPTFGPVVVFGHGGTGVEVIDDKALALPPLDLNLARELIARTRVSRMLQAYRNVPAARVDEVALVLVKLAQLAADVPEIRELDINPLLADQDGVIAIDARVAIARCAGGHHGRGHPRFAVQPYPKEWERSISLPDRTVFVRPVRPDDEDMYRAFFVRARPEDLRLRFFAPVRDLSHRFIARLTRIDYARAIALVAIDPSSGEMLGVVQLHADADYDRGEYAILVRSDLKGLGLGWRLMQTIIEYARWLGLRAIEGEVLRENSTMLAMCRELGFAITREPNDPDICVVTLTLA